MKILKRFVGEPWESDFEDQLKKSIPHGCKVVSVQEETVFDKSRKGDIERRIVVIYYWQKLRKEKA